jgi:hypothetical protein
VAHEDSVLSIMHALHIARDKDVGEVMASRGIWSQGPPSRNLSLRAMKANADLGKLERCHGYFRVPGCKSNFDDHARLLTESLVKICLLTQQYIVNIPCRLAYARMRLSS